MAKQFQRIEPVHRDFILRQRVFFTASAAAGGRVNVSPRGTDALRVLGANAVAYLDCTGSGNETAAHLRANRRLTLMFCAFDGPPTILRLYGQGRILPRRGADYANLLDAEFGCVEPPGARQIVTLDVDLVQTSCGYGVPLFNYVGERASLTRWAEAKGEAGLEAYRREKNVRSIDGLPTGLLDDVPTAVAASSE
jgi:Pyridoxamine 5'-phosphate oxidase